MGLLSNCHASIVDFLVGMVEGESRGTAMTTELTFLGGSGFRFRSEDTCLLVDPYWGGAPRKGIDRRQEPPFPVQDLYDSQYVLSTHAHLDHCDPRLLRLLHDNTLSQFIGPRSSVEVMTAAGLTEQRIVTAEAGDSFSLGDFSVVAGPGNDPLEPQAVTFHITHADITIFHSGDSLYSDLYKRASEQFPVDVALLNYGRELYMAADDVIRAAQDLGCRICIPMHWDLWEQFYEPPDALTGQYSKAPFKIVTLWSGDSIRLSKSKQGEFNIETL